MVPAVTVVGLRVDVSVAVTVAATAAVTTTATTTTTASGTGSMTVVWTASRRCAVWYRWPNPFTLCHIPMSTPTDRAAHKQVLKVASSYSIIR